jgi:hypothetical protein
VNLSAVLLARSIAIIDINDLNPRGALFFPTLVPLLVDRLGFQTFPTKAGDFDESKGVAFGDGYFDGQHITNLTVYNDGIKIDTRSSTREGRRILIETLEWMAKDVGLSFSEEMLTRWGVLSQLTFYADVDLLSLHPALDVASEMISAEVEKRLGTERKFVPYSVMINFDKGDAPSIPMAAFSVERRANEHPEKNKYYSSAPLDTDVHLNVLQEFENSVRSRR